MFTSNFLWFEHFMRYLCHIFVLTTTFFHLRLNENVRLLRMPETQLRSLDYEPYEFVDESRQISESSEWSELIQFALRKAERFMKSNAFEIAIPEGITESGRYSPRFIDEISDELNVFSDDSGIQDKKAPFLGKFN
jgi:hypothetical protein